VGRLWGGGCRVTKDKSLTLSKTGASREIWRAGRLFEGGGLQLGPGGGIIKDERKRATNKRGCLYLYFHSYLYFPRREKRGGGGWWVG